MDGLINISMIFKGKKKAVKYLINFCVFGERVSKYDRHVPHSTHLYHFSMLQQTGN